MNTQMKEPNEFESENPHGFIIPDDYFSQLKLELDEKLSNSHTRIRPIYRTKVIISIAASIVLLLASTFIFFELKKSDVTSSSIANLAIDTNTKAIIKTEDTALNNPTKVGLAESFQDTDNIDNSLIETADELNLTDDELIEFAEIINL